MKVSIITVTYNSAETLEQTIQSVIAQNHIDIEYIIVDGGSTDNTLNLISKYKSGITKFVSEKDQGLYDAINKGISMASGELIALLHSDDFYLNDSVITHYVQAFERSGSDAVYSDLYYVKQDDTNKITRKWKSGNYSEGDFFYGWMPPHPTLLIKKSIYNKYGNYSLALKSAADYELMLRFIHKNKITMSYLPEFTIKMRVGGKSNVSFKNRIKANLEDRKAWQINGLHPKFYTLFLKPIRKILQFF